MSRTRRRTGLNDLYAEHQLVLSYELFPPKTGKGMKALEGHLQRLLEFEPKFITCTYGAGGTGHEKTLATLALVQGLCDLPVASHLTCAGATADNLRAYLRHAAGAGVEFIVALRGDAPEGEDAFSAVDGGFANANELVALIRAEFPQFGVAVGGYPETHPEAVSPEADIGYLKQKVDAGGDVVLTQLFYNNEDFLRFRDRCAAAGIQAPIVPGILPITNYQQVKRITSLCGARLPKALTQRFEQNSEDPEGQFQVGIGHAVRQIEGLIDAGVPGLHFYVLNQSRATMTVLNSLGFPR